MELQVIVRNHSGEKQKFSVTPHVPAGWRAPVGPLRVSLPARAEGAVRVPLIVGAPGVGIVTADVAFGTCDLREWIEAIVTVS